MPDPFVEEVLSVESLTPTLDTPPSADEELALVERLVDPSIVDASETPVAAAEPPPPLGRSWYFDFEGRRFLTGGGHSPLTTHGVDTLRGWIEKCLQTPRGAAPIHSDEYGLDGLDDVIGNDTSEAAILEEAIRDALTFHPRIVEVMSFEVDASDTDDLVVVSFDVVLDDASIVTIADVTLGG